MKNRFLSFTEIQTKTASVLPFLLALLYTLYTYKSVNVRNTILFFAAMLLFDMSTTAINNYIDTRTNGRPLEYSRTAARRIIFVLLALATLAGIALAWFTGLVVLACGAVCFAVGIAYTYGPVAISRMPLGEVVSGIFMGFLIPFLTVYINAPDQSLVFYSWTGWVMQLSFNLIGLLKLFVLTLPAILCIADIMLANNIRDIDSDERVSRFTLPHYIGMKNALRLFALNYYMAYAAVILMAIFQVLPPYVLIVLASIVIIQRNIAAFAKNSVNPESFRFCIQNFLTIMLPLIVVAGTALFVGM
ncbi:MAG: UbiA family prenyltransferase [Saccharofermentanales bacterium]